MPQNNAVIKIKLAIVRFPKYDNNCMNCIKGSVVVLCSSFIISQKIEFFDDDDDGVITTIINKKIEQCGL
jgi:hypothetical protein